MLSTSSLSAAAAVTPLTTPKTTTTTTTPPPPPTTTTTPPPPPPLPPRPPPQPPQPPQARWMHTMTYMPKPTGGAAKPAGGARGKASDAVLLYVCHAADTLRSHLVAVASGCCGCGLLLLLLLLLLSGGLSLTNPANHTRRPAPSKQVRRVQLRVRAARRPVGAHHHQGVVPCHAHPVHPATGQGRGGGQQDEDKFQDSSGTLCCSCCC